jgi:beta-barrel assembly-enhancing protease
MRGWGCSMARIVCGVLIGCALWSPPTNAEAPEPAELVTSFHSSHYLQSILAKLQPHSLVNVGQVEIMVIPLGFKNAYALPPDTIVFTQGLLDSLESEQQIKFVLAHELGHLALHQSDRFQSLAPLHSSDHNTALEVEADAFAKLLLADDDSATEVLLKLAGEKASLTIEQRLEHVR